MEGRGSKIIQNCVTSFTNDPLFPNKMVFVLFKGFGVSRLSNMERDRNLYIIFCRISFVTFCDVLWRFVTLSVVLWHIVDLRTSCGRCLKKLPSLRCVANSTQKGKHFWKVVKKTNEINSKRQKSQKKFLCFSRMASRITTSKKWNNSFDKR